MIGLLMEGKSIHKKKFFSIILVFSFFIVVNFSLDQAFAEEKTVIIPFGAFNPELNTPAEVWYDPPTITVTVGDTVTWKNDDREGHTVTSGQGTGRFEWMDPNQGFGEPDGLFNSERFMPGESWSYTFEDAGAFQYFCVIHPWMQGFVIVGQTIPDYPHDASGKKLEEYPIILVTPDRSVEVNFSWDPQVIKTHEKVNFIYRFYDAVNDLPLRKLQYDISIIHNGNEIYRDEGAVSGAGGDYRQWIFEEPGDVLVKFRNIRGYGTVGGMEIKLTEESAGRIADFTTIVYENPEKLITTEKIVQPKETFQFYYEIAVLIIIVPAIMLGIIVLLMKRQKPILPPSGRKASPI